MTQPTIRVSPDGHELAALLRERVAAGDASGPSSGRRLLGVTGAPGAGKSALTAALLRLASNLSIRAAVVPMDGFHLADVQLERLGFADRKGAPETFDAWGYAALLARLRTRPSDPVYAPGFERDLEQPLAGAVVIEADVDLVITEGNYLLLERPEWKAVRAELDEVWHLVIDDDERTRRLIARHVRFGKSEDHARAWVARVDGANACIVEEARDRADLLLDLRSWRPD